MSVKIEPLNDRLIARIECLRENVDCARAVVEKKLFRKEMECMAIQDHAAYVARLLEGDLIISDLDSANLLTFAKELYKGIGRVDFVIFSTRFNIGGGEEVGDETILSFQLKEINVVGTHTMTNEDIHFVYADSEEMRITANYSDQLFDNPTWGVMIHGMGTITDQTEGGFGGESGKLMLMVDGVDNTKFSITDGVSKTHSHAHIWDAAEYGMMTYAITGESTARAFRNGVEFYVTAGNSDYSDIDIEESFVHLWHGGDASDFDVRFTFMLLPSDSENLIARQRAIYNLYKSTLYPF